MENHASETNAMHHHVAACMKNCIIWFGGYRNRYGATHSLRNIWFYNMFTEQWGKHTISDGMVPPETKYASATTIKEHVFMFGGLARQYTNALWKLTVSSKQCFEWSKIKIQSPKQEPSPRFRHSAWEYMDQLWTFGGHGFPLVGINLNGHGDFNRLGQNSQLFCFDPVSEEWRKLKTLGTPEPRFSHASTIIRDKVWMYGGRSETQNGPDVYYDDLHQLNMVTLIWTEIETGHVKPQKCYTCSLNAITEHQLLLHGGLSSTYQSLNDTWIFDLLSLSWRQYPASRNPPRNGHTGTSSINSSVIITGGLHQDSNITYHVCNDVITLRLEPKSLQQMAVWTIYQHRDVLPWKLLPYQLIFLFTFPVIYGKVD